MAASALANRNLLSVITISVLTLYLIGWSIASLTYPDILTANHGRFFNLVSTLASVALLVLSIMDYALERAQKAEKLQQNALHISTLMRKMERELASPTPDIDNLKGIASAYEEAVTKTHINHSPMDDTRWRYNNAGSKNVLLNTLFLIRSFAFGIYYSVLPMIFHLTIIIIVVGSTLWYMFFKIFHVS
jgi:hypothetical protein